MDDPDATLVDALEAPDWLLGMWRGTGSDGVRVAGFVSPVNIGVSPIGMPMMYYSELQDSMLYLVESNNNVFEYTVWLAGPNDTEILISEQWINNGDGSVLYTASGAREAQFTMHSTNASSFLAPPARLQGRWATQSVNGSAITIADINEGNIILGNQGEARSNYNSLANQPRSVFRVLTNDNTTYSFELTTVGANRNDTTVVTETFTQAGTNTIMYARDNTSAVTMTRQ